MLCYGINNTTYNQVLPIFNTLIILSYLLGTKQDVVIKVILLLLTHYKIIM